MKKILVFLFGTCIWAVGMLFGLKELPIEFAFTPETSGRIAVVSIAQDGTEKVSNWAAIKQGAARNFLSVAAKDLRFQVEDTSPTSSTWGLCEIRVLGITILNAGRIMRYSNGGCLKNATLDGDIVRFAVSGRDEFNIPLAFSFLLPILHSAVQVVAFLPLTLFALWVIVILLRMPSVQKILSLLNNRVTFGIALVAALLFTLPSPVYVVNTDLDSCWIWLENYFAFSPAWGGKFVFTYGPLGFFNMPVAIGTNPLLALVANVCVMICAGGVLWYLYACRHLKACAWMFLLALLLPWPNGMEWRWCALSILLCAEATLDEGCSRKSEVILLGIAGFWAAFVTFVKFSACISVLGEHIFLLGYAFIRRRREGYAPFVAYGVITLLSLGILGCLLFANVADFAAWVRGSLEIATGYNKYMLAFRTWAELIVPIFFVLFVSGLFLALCKNRKQAFIFLFLFSPIVFCTMKYALVRQTPIALFVLTASIMCFSPLAVKIRYTHAGLLMGLSAFCAMGYVMVFAPGSGVTALSGRHLVDTLTFSKSIREAQSKSAANCVSTLPREWLERIGTNEVGLIESRFADVTHTSLKVVPIWACQLYSAYTPWLDEKCAASLSAETAPRYILAPSSTETIDMKNPYFDNPKLWMAVKKHYEFVGVSGEHILLARRKVPLSTACDYWPGRFEEKKSILGMAAEFFFRGTRVAATIEFTAGPKYTCTINLPVLEANGCLAQLPTCAAEVPAFFGGKGPKPRTIQKISLRAEAPQHYSTLQTKL